VEEADCWTVAAVAAASGAPFMDLVEPPVVLLGDMDSESDSGGVSGGGGGGGGGGSVSGSVSEKRFEPVRKEDGKPSPLRRTMSDAGVDRREADRDIIELKDVKDFGAHALLVKAKAEAARAEAAADKDLPGKGVVRGRMNSRSEGLKDKAKEEKDEDEEEGELSFEEQQLLRCVALALSTSEGPPPELKAEVEALMLKDAALARRLVKVNFGFRRPFCRVSGFLKRYVFL